MFSVLYIELGDKDFFHLLKNFILLRFKKAPKHFEIFYQRRTRVP